MTMSFLLLVDGGTEPQAAVGSGPGEHLFLTQASKNSDTLGGFWRKAKGLRDWSRDLELVAIHLSLSYNPTSSSTAVRCPQGL